MINHIYQHRPTFIGLTILVMVAIVLMGNHPTSTLSPVIIANSHDVRLFNIHLVKYDINGLPTESITATKMIHNTPKNKYFFSSPDIFIQKNKGNDWRIHSRYAISDEKQLKILFKGDVRIDNHNKNKTPTHITTSQMYYLPKKQFAYTNQGVTINQNENHLVANGFKADLNQARIQLLGNVKGHYRETSH
jgi:LPS export ABC transporter protein LptC